MGWDSPKATTVGGIGTLSSKYESSGNPGTVAHTPGDIGGASYGTYQLATNTGSVKSFVNYLKNVSPSMYQQLAGKKPGTAAFDSAWKKVAASNPQQFNSLQHEYMRQGTFAPAVSKIVKSTGLDVSKRSEALQSVLWSTATQHGVGGANKVFKNAGISPNMSDAEIIRRIYTERAANNGMKYFPSSSPSVRKGVVNRFKSEVNDALSMLR